MKEGAKIFGLAVGVWLGILALAVASTFVVLGIRWITAGPKGSVEAREVILSGQNRIQAYEHFYNLCAAIQGLEGKLDAQLDELADSTDPADGNRIRTNISGLRGARAEAIATYNADARKDYTIGQFRDLELPYELPVDDYSKKGEHTSCVA